MKKWAYYNEIDKNAAQWLRNLIASGHIAPGEVDERSIEDVCPNDIRRFAQCHFFAGVGVWSYALRQAGWSDDRPAWTGSCPCQPFSAAGKGGGFTDERHLWPAFYHLIEQCRPPVCFGEQVASKAVEPWIDLVHTDVEALGYAFGCVAFPSAGVGAPHIRDRAYWVADSKHTLFGTQTSTTNHAESEINRPTDWAGGCGVSLGGLADASGARVRAKGFGAACAAATGVHGFDRQREWLRLDTGAMHGSEFDRMADATDKRLHGRRSGEASNGRDTAWLEPERFFNADGMANTNSDGFKKRDEIRLHGQEHDAQHGGGKVIEQPGPTNGFWRDVDWLVCRDGKWRAVESGLEPLVNGASNRVGRLRAYGNSITAQAASAFIESVMEATPA